MGARLCVRSRMRVCWCVYAKFERRGKYTTSRVCSSQVTRRQISWLLANVLHTNFGSLDIFLLAFYIDKMYSYSYLYDLMWYVRINIQSTGVQR